MRRALFLRILAALLALVGGATAFSACGARSGPDFITDAGSPDAGCALLGVACAADANCCSGFLCRDAVCKPEQLCKPEGDACTQGVDCCDFDCLAGFCGGVECNTTGEACSLPDDCCDFDCVNGFCGGVPCKPEGALCSSG